jgi:SOS-response transcriptional repressor LexA
MKPTDKQRRILRLIVQLSEKQGYTPSVAELAAASNISHNAAHELLVRLRDKGFVTWRPRASRTLALTESARSHV